MSKFRSGQYGLSISGRAFRRPRSHRKLRLELLEDRRLLASDVLFRINAGGPQLSADPVWEADTGANPSSYNNALVGNSAVRTTTDAVNISHTSIPAGTPMAVFQSERFDKSGAPNMEWAFPVTSGEYEVRLYFAETWSGAFSAGIRQFDVAIEGSTVLNDYDIFADVGAMKGVVKKFTVTSDANLNIHFLRELQNPIINGIEILSIVAEDNGAVTASSSAVDFGTVQVGQSAQQQIILTNSGPDGGLDVTIDPSQASIAPSGSPFSVSFQQSGPIVLSPGQSTVVTVTYAPTTAASDSAVLTIPHSGTNSPIGISLSGTAVSEVPISFGKSTLAGTAGLERPTSLQFGPDGRLYVSQQNGLIRAYTVTRNDVNNYSVVDQEDITLIQQIPNHDDDGALNPTINTRLVTGILVVGTAENPVLYVTSSDPRIGGGNSGTDLNLDTNSSMVSRLTWNGSSWQREDLVRGLPRSEENHAANGIQLDALTNTLYVAMGGNTNMGAPSNNFSFLPEYALSAAILAIELNSIGTSTYDLPTLDDESRSGVNDANDPFGGNDGKNQAKLVPGGPVKVYAPGFRNPYDLIITSQGRMYTVDNGPNAGWGDVPINEGPEGLATNDPNEPGVTHGDGLHFVTASGYYGGHPNPTRSNPANTFNTTNPQSPVTTGNAIESDYQIPGVENGALVVFGDSTNGIAEYTAGNFDGAMQGDLIIASFDNTIKRVKLNSSGDQVVLSENLFSSVGFRPLDVTTPATGSFAGSIWVVDIALGVVIVFEPSDGSSGDPNDFDGDGYSNDDELANGTDPNNAADVPPDYDMDFVSNLSDPDDDNDSLLDNVDRFAVDPNNGLTTPVGTIHHWENEGENAGGVLGLGFTGLMTNGIDDYESLFDPQAVTAGGAAGVFTIDSATAGTARGTTNTQEQAFQFGVNVANETLPFIAQTRILGAFNGLTPQAGQEMGLYVGTGDQDNYIQIVLSGDSGGSVQLLSEINGSVTPLASQPISLPGPSAIDLWLVIDPVSNTLQAMYSTNSTTFVNLGGLVSIPPAWLDGTLAVGVIATNPSSSALPVTWDFLGIVSDSQAGEAAAKLEIFPQGSINNSSTARDNSFRIYNNSTGSRQIDSVTININTSFMPDMLFDPNGTAGDVVGVAFTPNSGSTETGLSTHAFLVPRDGGFEQLKVDFTNFDPGEIFTFRVDVDPTSVKGSAQPGPSNAADVSGLELSGAIITVDFSDGTILTGQVFALDEGASFYKVHSEVVLTSDPVSSAPQLNLVGVTTPTIVQSAAQTVRVTGPVGAAVRLLQTEVALHLAGVPNGGYDIDPFEANKVVFVRDDTAVISGSGSVDIPVTLNDSLVEGGINYFIAVIDEPDGRTSAVSNVIKVALNDLPPGSVSGSGANLAIASATAIQNEGNSGTTAFTFTVTRSGETSGTTSVNYAVTGSGTSPANAADFGGTLPSGSVTFSAGQTSQPITVNVTGDTEIEPDETFTVTLSNPSTGAQITTASAIGTILNDDAQSGENGLLGEYFNGTDLTGLAGTRVDATVNFPQDWGNAPPGTAVTADDKYSVRWSGFVETSTAGSWTFFTTSNDGVRLWIDNELVIDNWTTHAVTENSATRSLTAGWHALRLEYFQQNGTAEITLSFQGPDQSKAIIPQSKLRTTDPSSGIAQFAVAPLEGDYDDNGVVDHDDYGVWRGSYGMAGLASNAVGNRDGIVDSASYVLWRANLGATLSGTIIPGSDAQSGFALLDSENTEGIATDETLVEFPSQQSVLGHLSPVALNTARGFTSSSPSTNSLEPQSREIDLLMVTTFSGEMMENTSDVDGDSDRDTIQSSASDEEEAALAVAFESFDPKIVALFSA